MMAAAVVFAIVVAAALAVLVAGRRRLALVTVRGVSMEPSFHDGDRLLARRSRGVPRRGDVVVVERPDDPRARTLSPYLVKRVVAVEGDPTSADDLPPPVRDTYVPPGHVVLRGDNPHTSLDSRVVGYFDARRVRFVVLSRHRPTDSPRHSRGEKERTQR